MKIVVIGGSGLIGSKLVRKLLPLGHTVVAASPATGVNTITGEGLYEVLKETDVVVDVSNALSFDDKAVLGFFQRSTLNLLTAEAYAGVKHHIALSVVGAERLPDSVYFNAKVVQEELIEESGVAFSILRSTQFFELANRIAQAGTIGDEVYISPAPFQPIAADEVVTVLTDLAHGTPLNNTIEVAGPVLMPMYEFIRYYMNETEDPRRLLMDEHALFFGTELNDESLIPSEGARIGKTKYEDWFIRQLAMHGS